MIKSLFKRPVKTKLIEDIRQVCEELPNGDIEITYLPFDASSELNFGNFDDWRPQALIDAGVTPSVISPTSTSRIASASALGSMVEQAETILNEMSNENNNN